MQAARHDTGPELPGNHGQFGESVTTETYRPLRATQRVTVKPVIPRGAMRSGSDNSNAVPTGKVAG